MGGWVGVEVCEGVCVDFVEDFFGVAAVDPGGSCHPAGSPGLSGVVAGGVFQPWLGVGECCRALAVGAFAGTQGRGDFVAGARVQIGGGSFDELQEEGEGQIIGGGEPCDEGCPGGVGHGGGFPLLEAESDDDGAVGFRGGGVQGPVGQDVGDESGKVVPGTGGGEPGGVCPCRDCLVADRLGTVGGERSPRFGCPGGRGGAGDGDPPAWVLGEPGCKFLPGLGRGGGVAEIGGVRGEPEGAGVAEDPGASGGFGEVNGFLFSGGHGTDDVVPGRPGCGAGGRGPGMEGGGGACLGEGTGVDVLVVLPLWAGQGGLGAVVVTEPVPVDRASGQNRDYFECFEFGCDFFWVGAGQGGDGQVKRGLVGEPGSDKGDSRVGCVRGEPAGQFQGREGVVSIGLGFDAGDGAADGDFGVVDVVVLARRSDCVDAGCLDDGG